MEEELAGAGLEEKVEFSWVGGLRVEGTFQSRSAEMGLHLVCLSNNEWTCLAAGRSA